MNVRKNESFPEGGYGWVIVISCALINFLTMTIIQAFGIVLKVTFAELNFSATQISLIVAMNASFGLVTGPFTGLVQKTYGCRKTAIFSAFLATLGMILTSISQSFTLFVVSYGIITSLGTQMAEATDRLVLSQYFKKKRSLVTGFVLTFAGLAPIFMPQLFRYLLKVYTSHQTILIFAGILANLFVSGVLLQPVEWHIKKDSAEEKMIEQRPKKRVNFLDGELLKDPVFYNIIIGVSLVAMAEMNFMLLLPFILYDFGLNIDQVAIFVSILGTTDLISRFVSPYIGNYFKKSSRFMYAVSLVILTTTKFIFIFCTSFINFQIIAVILGCAKGFRKVYMWLIIPDYVPLEKLPAASGIDMALRGIFILAGGISLGLLRDFFGSYVVCIIFMNSLVITTLIAWTIEALIKKLS